MTAQTISYLKNSEFTLTGAAGRIIPQNMQDLCDTVQARTPQYNVMIPEYGAANTGSSHPLSGVTLFQGQNTTGWTLTQWQTVFSAAVGSGGVATCELDWCAAQLAITNASTNGGVVWFPAGAGYWFTNTNSTTDGSGPLTPPATSNPTYSPGVSLLGDAWGTYLNWKNDLGAGKAGIICGGRVSGSSGGFFQGLILIGPGAGSTLGSTSCQMGGIMTNDRRNIYQCNIQGFKYGIDNVGGQCSWNDLHLVSNYYGIYFNTGNSGNFGNMNINRVICDSSLRAALAVNQAVAISNCDFWGCFFGTAPFGIYKETNSGSPSVSSVTSGCTFYNCQFENIGNAWISDDTASNSTRVVQVYNTTFVRPQFLWNTGTYKIGGTTNYAVVDIGISEDFYIQNINNPEQLSPGTIATFNVLTNSGFRIDGDLYTIFGNATTAGVSCFAGDWHLGCCELFYHGPNALPWSGGTANFAAGAVNNVMILSAGSLTTCTGTSTEVPIGVAQYVGSNGWGVFANKGTAVVTTSGSITASLKLYTSSSGATITSATTTAPIGAAISNSATNLWNVWLRGLD